MKVRYQYDPAQLKAIFEQARYVESVIQLMRPAPAGKPKNWKVYRTRFIDNIRIQAGMAFWDRNQDALKRAEEQFGVPAEIVVGLIGVETIYGRTMGKFRLIDSLTTLAFSYPDTPNKVARMRFFQDELAQLLLWSKESGNDLFALKGSYAGAIGLSQFMPSSVRQYAVDFDGDGKINLKDSEVDAIGSVANYLAQHGWKKSLPYAFPASFTNQQIDQNRLSEVISQGLKASYHIEQLKELVSTPDVSAPAHILYGLIDLQNGEDPTEYWLATENFFAITQYNRSYFYTMSVIDLGKLIAEARQKN
jgi:membrane-bound lytic murein transglycosylase B